MNSVLGGISTVPTMYREEDEKYVHILTARGIYELNCLCYCAHQKVKLLVNLEDYLMR